MQPSLTGLDYQKLLYWYGFHEEHGLRNSSNVFPFFSSASCLKNEAVNQLKANIIYWKATQVSLDYTHRLAARAHFERNLPPSSLTTFLYRFYANWRFFKACYFTILLLILDITKKKTDFIILSWSNKHTITLEIISRKLLIIHETNLLVGRY